MLLLSFLLNLSFELNKLAARYRYKMYTFSLPSLVSDLELQLTPISSYSLLTLKFNNTWHPVCDMFSVPGLTLPMTDTLASELCRVMGYSTGIYHNTSLLSAGIASTLNLEGRGGQPYLNLLLPPSSDVKIGLGLNRFFKGFKVF